MRMFEICQWDDELIHDARQSQSHVMNVEFEKVRVEDSLQHHQQRSYWLNERLNIVQEYSIQHEWVSRHDSRIDEKDAMHVNEEFNIRRQQLQHVQNSMSFVKRQFNWEHSKLKFHSE